MKLRLFFSEQAHSAGLFSTGSATFYPMVG